MSTMEIPWPLAIMVGALIVAALADTFIFGGFIASAFDGSDER